MALTFTKGGSLNLLWNLEISIWSYIFIKLACVEGFLPAFLQERIDRLTVSGTQKKTKQKICEAIETSWSRYRYLAIKYYAANEMCADEIISVTANNATGKLVIFEAT